MNDKDYMRRAITLARRGEGWTNPNPMVGAVIVKDGRIIGEGYHHRCGALHAEREALSSCTEDPQGAVIYVTLEPCCHHGKQPPCTDALIAAGISRVVIGSRDPNPLVHGKGAKLLREHGMIVEEDFLREECDALNPVFFHYIQTKRPYVAMKYAMTMDGKIACYTGASKWVTGEQAREEVQHLRHRYMGIMAGIGTVLADDPMLTCRCEGGRNPVRIICDTQLRIPVNAKIAQSAKDVRTILATASTDQEKISALEDMGCTVLVLPQKDGHIDLDALMVRLGEAGIDSILLEGGGTLNYSMLESGHVQKVYAYIAPKIFGGDAAKSPVEGRGMARPEDAIMLRDKQVRQVGEDICIEAEVEYVHRDH